jgi:uncharacterized membrane protein
MSWVVEQLMLTLLGGGALYPIDSFAATALFNLPGNDALAKFAPSDSGSATLWTQYVASWTKWNHVPTVASLASAASFSLALRA